MKYKIFYLILMIILICTGVIMFGNQKSINAKNEIEKIKLEEYFTVDELEREMFADELLTQITMQQLQQIREDFYKDYGELEEIERIGPYEFEVYLAEGILETTFALNEKNEITSLLFTAVSKRIDELEELIAEFDGLEGEVSLLVTKNDEEIAAINKDKSLSVASTFKIAVLAALSEKVDKGEIEWEDVTYLNEEHKSLPSGVLQDWPEDISFTLESLAAKMISLSDNTATDILIDYLGRENITEYIPQEDPLLTTREMFILKAPDNADLLDKYREACTEGRYNILEEIIKDKELPSGIEYTHQEVRALDTGWYFTVEELKSLMKKVHDLEIMQINSGVINDEYWKKISYKGGSDLGVLNYTTLLESESGQEYFISGTWNKEGKIDEKKFDRLYRNLGNIIQKKDNN